MLQPLAAMGSTVSLATPETRTIATARGAAFSARVAARSKQFNLTLIRETSGMRSIDTKARAGGPALGARDVSKPEGDDASASGTLPVPVVATSPLLLTTQCNAYWHSSRQHRPVLYHHHPRP